MPSCIKFALLDMVKDTFKSKYNPNKNETIDETMVKYKGIFSIKQYMPGQYAYRKNIFRSKL